MNKVRVIIKKCLDKAALAKCEAALYAAQTLELLNTDKERLKGKKGLEEG